MLYLIAKTIIPNNFKFYIKRFLGIDRFSMFRALQRCKKRGIQVSSVIDVGASSGSWSKLCLNVYPKAFYLLIEAQQIRRVQLESFKKLIPNSNFYIAAAGDKNGKLFFDASEIEGGLASHSIIENVENLIEVDAFTIDFLVERDKIEGPYLIKLDTHGFELPIIDGAKKTLLNSNLVIIESYNQKLTNESLKFYELCSYMSKLGFEPIEIVDVSHRLYDESLWQMDIFFIKKDRPEFLHNKYV